MASDGNITALLIIILHYSLTEQSMTINRPGSSLLTSKSDPEGEPRYPAKHNEVMKVVEKLMGCYLYLS